jgi:glutamine synthetase adenylyltransferase
MMDVEFLATGSLLERGAAPGPDVLPSIAALLRFAAPGAAVEALLGEYAFLRRVEGCARLIAGRPIEVVETSGEGALILAEIIEPGLTRPELVERIERARRAIRSSYDAVIEAGSIAALAS